MTEPTFQAIETSYAGCRFRSRLEARWAVFFDHLSIPWEYEAQGYDVYGRRYLPDFRIEALGEDRKPVLVEVKGEKSRVDRKLTGDTVRTVGIPVLTLGPVPRPGLAPYLHPIVVPMGNCRNCEQPSNPSYESAIFVGSGLLYMWAGGGVLGARFPLTQGHGGVELGYKAARSARFEHGESGAANPDTRRLKAFSRILEGD